MCGSTSNYSIRGEFAITGNYHRELLYGRRYDPAQQNSNLSMNLHRFRGAEKEIEEERSSSPNAPGHTQLQYWRVG